MNDLDPLRGLQTLREFPLLDALLGRRSRRFFQGARVPDGVFAYDSRHPPLPLSELETLLVVGACGGCTGWQDLIYRADRYVLWVPLRRPQRPLIPRTTKGER